MNEPFDAQRLLRTLSFRPINAARNLLDGYEPPIWRYPLLGSYNGFTGEQRVRTWQLGTWLRRRDLLTLAPACDLCGRSARLGRHSENYADVERALTICGGCHLVLHTRFRQPCRWRATLDRLPHVPEWALALSPTPIDLPQWLQSVGAPSDPFDWLRRQRPLDPTIEPAARTVTLRSDLMQADLFHPH